MTLSQARKQREWFSCYTRSICCFPRHALAPSFSCFHQLSEKKRSLFLPANVKSLQCHRQGNQDRWKSSSDWKGSKWSNCNPDWDFIKTGKFIKLEPGFQQKESTLLIEHCYSVMTASPNWSKTFEVVLAFFLPLLLFLHFRSLWHCINESRRGIVVSVILRPSKTRFQSPFNYNKAHWAAFGQLYCTKPKFDSSWFGEYTTFIYHYGELHLTSSQNKACHIIT